MAHICRLCLKAIAKESKVVPIIGIDSNGVDVTTLVKAIVPEMYIGLSQNPVLCQPCYDSLSDAYSFRLLCLRSENLIGIFMRETETMTQVVDLQRVVNYWKTVYKKNRRDISATKTNLAEWFGVDDVQSIVEQSDDKPAKIFRTFGPQRKKHILHKIAATQPSSSTEKNNDSKGIITENEASKCLDISVLKEQPKEGSSFLRLREGFVDLCGCPPVHDCPTNANFNVFVDEKRRETMRKKHAACNMLCDYRHMRTCKYAKLQKSKQPETETDKATENLNISDRPIEASHGTNIEKPIDGKAEKNETTCNAEETPEDKNDEEDEIDVLSLLQQLQENENLEKLGLMENATNLQDLYVIKKVFDEQDNSFNYALIPKSVAEGQCPEEKCLPKNNVRAEDTNTCSNEAGANSAILNSRIALSPEKDGTEKADNKNVETVTRRKSFSNSSDSLFTPLEIKKERADEDILSSILGVPPEDLPITVTKPIEEVEKDPLDISNNQTEERTFIRVRSVESLKPTCSLTVEPLPEADSLNLVIPEPSTSVAFPNLLTGSVPPLPAIVGLNENNLPPPILSPITDINPEGTVSSYVSQRPLYTTSSPPPLHLCVSKLPNSNLSNSKKRKAPKAAPKKSAKSRKTKKSTEDKLSESNPDPLVAIPVSLEMPLTKSDAEDDIVIKKEPLEYNDGGDDFEHIDKALSKRPSEETSNLSKLIDDPPLNDDQLDVPEYIQIKNVSLVNISNLVQKGIQTKKKEPKPPKAVDNVPPIRMPQSLSELLDAKPNKSEPENYESLDLLTKSIEDDPSYDADRDPLYLPPAGFRQRKRDFKRFIELSDEEKAKRMRRSNRVSRKKVDKLNLEPPKGTRRKVSKTDQIKCVLPTKFTSEGDYVNDHDYFISPYARNRMASVRRKGGEHCICLLCDLIHVSSKHIDHMTAHYTKCAICGADFENVFVLNMHVRKHTSHCRECKLSVTYARFFHHAETHNRTAGMSKIPLPLPPKFPLSEKDFLDELEPNICDAFPQKRKLCCPNPNVKKRKKAAGKEPKQMEKNAFCKPSSITLTELLRSPRPTNINSTMTDKRSVLNSSGSTKKKTNLVKRKKKTKTANQKKPFTSSRLSKIVDEIVNIAKELKSSRSEIIESHVYTKEGNSGDGQENENELTKYSTGSVSMQEPLNTETIAEKATIVEKSHDPPSSDNISLTGLLDDASSLKSTEPLGIKIVKVDATVINKMFALAATNTLESHSNNEAPIAEEVGFKLTNKITKQPTNSKQTENEAQDNPEQAFQTDCYVDFTDMSSTGHTTSESLPAEKLPKNVEQVANVDAHVSVSNLKPISGTDESLKSLTSAVVPDGVLMPSTAAKKKVICKEKVAKITAYLKSNIKPSIPSCSTSEITSTADADVEHLAAASNDVSLSAIQIVDNNVIAVESPHRGEQNRDENINPVEETQSSLAENIPNTD